MAELMDARAELRAGLRPSRAADIMGALHRQELYLAFTQELGSSVEAYKAWLYAALCRELLPGARCGGCRSCWGSCDRWHLVQGS